MYFLLLASSFALAHRPHTVVPAMAIPEDFPTQGHAWLVCTPGPISLLMTTNDMGVHWEYVGGAPTVDDLLSGAASGSTIYFLGATGNVWSTDDDGASWDSAALPGAATATDLDVVGGDLLAGGDVLWWGDAGSPGSATVIVPTAMTDVDIDDDDSSLIAAAAADGTVVASTSGPSGITPLLPLPDSDLALGVAWVNGELYTHSLSTIYASRAGDWVQCGAVPFTDAATPHSAEIGRLAASRDGRLTVATGAQAVFVSDDGCVTWSFLDVGAEMAPIYGAIGYAQATSEAFSTLWVDGDTLLVAGWNGLVTSADGGGSWAFPKLVSSDSVRGFSMAPDFPTNPRMAVGQYGGAVVWTDDGGEVWTGSAVGLDHMYGYDVAIVDEEVLLYAALEAFRSADGGLTWAGLDVPMERTRVFTVTPDVIFALGEDSQGVVSGRVAISRDRGATWLDLPKFNELVGNSTASSVTTANMGGITRWLVATDADPGLAVSDDEGATWRWLWQTQTEVQLQLAAGVASWPAGEATRLAFANEVDGVLLSDDGGATWRPATTQPTSVPLTMTGTDDGTMFVGSGDGLMFRSEDGGETWVNLGVTFGTSGHVIKPAPGFAQNGIAIVGTSVGEYWTNDRGDTWNLMQRYERFEDNTFHLLCYKSDGVTACDNYVDPTAGNGGGYLLLTLDTASFTFEGDAFSVIGPKDGEGVATVVIDGVQQADWTPDGTPLTVTGLPLGWHDVSITGAIATADGIHIDVVETYGEGTALPIPGASDDSGDSADSGDSGDTGTIRGRCACKGGRDAGVFMVPFGLFGLGTALLRRRGGGRSRR